MFAPDLISRRVVTGRSEERLADVAARLKIAGTHHCVVLDDSHRHFVGLIQLADVMGRSNAGNRILADLITPVQPVRVHPHDTAAHVAALFERYELTEVVLVEGENNYLGLITAQSVLEWLRHEYRRNERDLAQALAWAKSASEAKDNFIAAVSHELRTPLTPALLVASAAAADTALPLEVRHSFEVIAESVTQEAHLVNDLINHGQLLRGEVALQRNAVALHDVLKEVAESAQASLRSKSLRFSFQPAGGDPQVDGDRARLAHVFTELLTNAIRHTPPEGEVSVLTDLGSGAYVTIRFVDSGVGFSPEDIARMFEPFAELTRRPGELGLGLPIARGLVEMHAGQLQVESGGRDRGAVFVVKLPLRPESPKPASVAPFLAERIIPFPADAREKLPEDRRDERSQLVAN